MIEPLFSSFSLSSFCEVVVFAVFELRFMSSAWRARRGAALDPWSTQRELSILYARFYGALLGGILLSYHLQRCMPLLVFALYGFWLPQAALCVRLDCRQPLRPRYVVGTSICRLALPLYLYGEGWWCVRWGGGAGLRGVGGKAAAGEASQPGSRDACASPHHCAPPLPPPSGCPHNMLRIEPNYGLCAALVLFVGAQAAVLVAQHVRGPRCFVPRRFLPPRYDYHRSAPPRRGDLETGEGGGAECVVCMSGVDLGAKAHRMLTPCGHAFHNHCLSRWMAVKLECPTCRTALPPP